jgi:hypothetical protein
MVINPRSADVVGQVQHGVLAGGDTDIIVRDGAVPAQRVAGPPDSVRRFDRASVKVLAHLGEVAPMGAWAVTRVVDGRQVVLTVDDQAFGLEVGADFAFAAAMCSGMVSGAAPQVAPDISIMPQYVEAAAVAGLKVGAYISIPIVLPDGELFGTVCGIHPTVLPASRGRRRCGPLPAARSRRVGGDGRLLGDRSCH